MCRNDGFFRIKVNSEIYSETLKKAFIVNFVVELE